MEAYTVLLRKKDVEHLVVDVEEDGNGVKWARTCDGPVCVNSSAKTTCYGCGDKLTFVKAHKSRRNGIEHDVVAYFRHSGVRSNCSSETIAHKAAKHALKAYGRTWKYSFSCKNCGGCIPIEVCGNETHVFEEETAWKQYRLDVGVLAEGEVVGAIEVMHTHACTKNKRRDLTESGVAWCEVSTASVMRAVELQSFDLKVLDCAVTFCDECVESQKRSVIERLEDESRRARHDAEDLFKKRKRIVDDATTEWVNMNPSDDHDETENKWIALSQKVQHAVANAAEELGLDSDAAQKQATEILEGDFVLTFGKYKGRTLSFVKRKQWSYMLWLAGYDFGKVDDKCRPIKRRPGKGAEFVPGELQAEALKKIKGLCFGCAAPIPNYDDNPWKTYCWSCYIAYKN